MKLRRTAPPQGNAILKPQWPPSTAERFIPVGAQHSCAPLGKLLPSAGIVLLDFSGNKIECSRELVLLHIFLALDDSRAIATLALRRRRCGRSRFGNRRGGRRRHSRIAKTRPSRRQS